MRTDAGATFSELENVVKNTIRKKPPDFLSSVLHLIAACADVSEPFQWRSPRKSKIWVQAHRKEFAYLLGRVLYWIINVSICLKIDLAKAFEEKLIVIEKKYPLKKE